MSVLRHFRVGFCKDQPSEIIFRLAPFILNIQMKSPKNTEDKYCQAQSQLKLSWTELALVLISPMHPQPPPTLESTNT